MTTLGSAAISVAGLVKTFGAVRALAAADPSKEAGLGQMSENKSGPVNKPEQHDKDRAQNQRHRERTADELTDQSEAVSPTDQEAHGGRRKGRGK